MNGWVLVRSDDGAFVADMRKSTSGSSYTRNILKAKVYPSWEAADRDRCPGNETPVNIEEIFR